MFFEKFIDTEVIKKKKGGVKWFVLDSTNSIGPSHVMETALF